MLDQWERSWWPHLAQWLVHSVTVEVPELRELSHFLYENCTFQELSRGELSAPGCTGPRVLKPIRADDGFGASAPLIYLEHICLRLSGRCSLKWRADIPPAGSRLSSVCCNRKASALARSGEGTLARAQPASPFDSQGQILLPYCPREMRGSNSASLLCRWNARFYFKPTFHSDCLQLGSEGRRQSGSREGEQRERNCTDFSPYKQICSSSSDSSKFHRYQGHVVFYLFVDKIRSHVRFVNCVRCLLSHSTWLFWGDLNALPWFPAGFDWWHPSNPVWGKKYCFRDRDPPFLYFSRTVFLWNSHITVKWLKSKIQLA